MDAPKEIKEHQYKYNEGVWKDYSYEELIWWVKLLAKRSTHRAIEEKAMKDLKDAKNYFEMYMMKAEADILYSDNFSGNARNSIIYATKSFSERFVVKEIASEINDDE